MARLFDYDRAAKDKITRGNTQLLHLLRLPDKMVGDLRTLGFQSIGELANTARATAGAQVRPRDRPPLGSDVRPRFGANRPHPHAGTDRGRPCVRGIGAAATINKYVGRLVVQLVDELQRKGLGVRRTDLIVEKVDGTRQAIRAGRVRGGGIETPGRTLKTMRHRE